MLINKRAALQQPTMVYLVVLLFVIPLYTLQTVSCSSSSSDVYLFYASPVTSEHKAGLYGGQVEPSQPSRLRDPMRFGYECVNYPENNEIFNYYQDEAHLEVGYLYSRNQCHCSE